MIVVNSSTRQFNIPGADLVFGVESDSGSVIKEFQCPRYVGNNLDLTGCFIRMNYRNANGEIDSYLVKNVTVNGDNVVFGWELAPKVTMYKGNVSFVMCVVGPDTKVKWHTTLGRGQVLEGLEPDEALVEEGTADVVATLIAMVEAQTEAVADTGAEWVRNVQSEGTDQIIAVQTAARESREAAVAEIEAKGVNTRNSIPADYTALSETVDGLMRSRAGAIICEAAGSAITVNDASDNYVQGLRIFGRSTQDGTPTPDAPVEIVSVDKPVVTVSGKNLIPYPYYQNSVTSSGATFTAQDDGGILGSGTATAATGITIYDGDVLGSGMITASLSGTFTNMVWQIVLLDAANNELVKHQNMLEATIDLAEYPTATRMRLFVKRRSNSEISGTAYPQLEIGEVATEYEVPGAAQTLELTHTLPGIPVTSGGNYTDSDGQQWICDEVDLERGVYVQRINTVTYDGVDETWALNQLGSFARFTAARNDIKNSSERTGFLCTHFTSEDITTDRVGLCFIGTSTPGQFYFYPNADITTVDQWKEWLTQNPVTVYFALATPIETTLSETEIAAYRALHSNYPNTTVLNDAGAHMVVKYAADTKLYIDNKIAALIGG